MGEIVKDNEEINGRKAVISRDVINEVAVIDKYSTNLLEESFELFKQPGPPQVSLA